VVVLLAGCSVKSKDEPAVTPEVPAKLVEKEPEVTKALESQENDKKDKTVHTGNEEKITLEESRIIEEQSFDMEWGEMGKVRFVSYRPDAQADRQDVTFYLVKDGVVVYSFPYKNDQIQSSTGLFDEVEAVSFRDADGDGTKDILLILDYITGAGPQGMIPRPEPRVYLARGNEYIIDEQLADQMKEAIEEENLTIQTMMEYLKKHE